MTLWFPHQGCDLTQNHFHINQRSGGKHKQSSMMGIDGRAKGRRGRRPYVALDDRGSASVAMLAVITAAFVFGIAAFGVCGAVVANRRAQAAADLGALAGAQVVATSSACEHATEIALRNHGRVTSCDVEGVDVLVTVRVPFTGMLGATGASAIAQARAGPDPIAAAGPGPDVERTGT